jgi:hypothetical protein
VCENRHRPTKQPTARRLTSQAVIAQQQCDLCVSAAELVATQRDLLELLGDKPARSAAAAGGSNDGAGPGASPSVLASDAVKVRLCF